MSGKAGNISDAVIRDFCISDSSQISIKDSTIWNSVKWLKGNLVIENSAVLVINCELSMPQNAFIKILAGGKLIINGGIVSNSCQLQWNGIIYSEEYIDIKQLIKIGALEINNNGKIENFINN